MLWRNASIVANGQGLDQVNMLCAEKRLKQDSHYPLIEWANQKKLATFLRR